MTKPAPTPKSTMQIVPYAPEHVPAVVAFNQRLKAGGDDRFHLQETPPNGDSLHNKFNQISQEQYLVVEDGATVRGGYTLNRGIAMVEGSPRQYGFLQIPLSEGIVDPAYKSVGTRLLMDAHKKSEFLFALGMGGVEQPLPRLLKALGAEVRDVPFFF